MARRRVLLSLVASTSQLLYPQCPPKFGRKRYLVLVGGKVKRESGGKGATLDGAHLTFLGLTAKTSPQNQLLFNMR